MFFEEVKKTAFLVTGCTITSYFPGRVKKKNFPILKLNASYTLHPPSRLVIFILRVWNQFSLYFYAISTPPTAIRHMWLMLLPLGRPYMFETLGETLPGSCFLISDPCIRLQPIWWVNSFDKTGSPIYCSQALLSFCKSMPFSGCL